jgi:hypothetical protein
MMVPAAAKGKCRHSRPKKVCWAVEAPTDQLQHKIETQLICNNNIVFGQQDGWSMQSIQSNP